MVELHTPSQAAQWLKSRVNGTLRADSRALVLGDGFIAWPGTATDGRKFAQNALAQGASACLMEQAGADVFDLYGNGFATYPGLKVDTGAIASEFFNSPSQDLSLVAITGTNGKTSTAWWLAQALSALPSNMAMPCGVIGTLGVGSPPHVVSTGLTTPDPVMLQKTLREFVDAGLKVCAVEASSIGIEEHRLNGTHVRVAVFTNFSQDHLDYHGSMAAYWSAKQRLFSWAGLCAAVINVDDIKGAELADELFQSGLDVWPVSQIQPTRLHGRNVRHSAQGMQLDVVEGGTTFVLHTRLIGTYNVSNLLGVIGAMRCLGVPLQYAVEVCGQLSPVPGRMECVGGVDEPLVAVDYAHTPDALAQALAALRPMAEQRNGKLWCIFGCGGDRDASKRPLMGAIAGKGADKVVVTSDNPRNEKPEAIITHILLGLPQGNDVNVQLDRAAAIAHTVAQADVNDVILLAGKGHETTQDVAGSKTEFSDLVHATRALQLRSSGAGTLI
jgi:UDP-N-acetylmuramoyl-L-alanyl-D-glutamate--2,6-diaminopimelate ligase